MRFLAVICVVAVVGTGCARGQNERVATEPTPSTSSSESPTAAPGTRYASIDDLAARMEDGGLPCTSLSYLKQSNPTLKEFALCDPNGDAHQRLDIYLFRNSSDRDEWIGAIVQSELPWLLGPNWIVVAAGDPTTAEDRIDVVQTAIGGQIPQVEF